MGRIFSFPVFALTTTLASPVTVFLYQPRYAESAAFLAIISIGTYVNAAFGFNGLTMRVFGRLRFILVTNLVIVVINVALNLALIPSFGAAGGAVAMAVTLVAHNVLKQFGLRRTGIDLFDWRYARVYIVIVVAAGLLALVEFIVAPPLFVGVALVGVASLAVVYLNRRLLDVSETFPRLLRVPLLRTLLAR